MSMSEIESEVLDELYFLTSFEDLFKNAGLTQKEVKSALKSLLSKQYISQHLYSEKLKDFERCTAPDFENLEQFHYLATKQGLLAQHT